MLFAVLMLSAWFAVSASAVTVWYQPMPYPTKAVIDARASNTDPLVSIPHIVDGWITNVYYGQNFVQDDRLQIGGWGDTYRTYLKLDLYGLPKDVSEAGLFLMPYASGGSSSTTWTNLSIINDNWNTGMTWNNQPGVTSLGWLSPPIANQWQGVNITQWYNEWKLGSRFNYGFQMSPWQTTNKFNMFRSSRYAGDDYRPFLRLSFTPTLELKMPFDGNFWKVTTEIGGTGCSYLHSGHQWNGYFSIDFSGKAVDASGNIVYPDPSVANIPILAAAGGTVVEVSETGTGGAGFYVRIEHMGTGIKTGYLHMKTRALVNVGNIIPQGKLLGYMGNTPTSANMGVHLDFNVQYNGSGSKEQDPLAKVVMDGWLLKSFQVDNCINGDSNRYYQSSNVKINP